MLIPIERPLIDARNIRDAATQTVSAGFVATHNQKTVLLLTCDSADRASGAPHIQAGVKAGQKLLIIVTDDANRVTITDGGGTGTDLNGAWAVADAKGIGAWLKVVWDGIRWWETGRGNGALTASGRVAHAEGSYSTASGDWSHAQNSSGVASASGTHVEGSQCTASVNYANAGGQQSVANHYAGYARAGGRFADNGDAQFVRVVGRNLITMSSSWQNILFLDGVDDRLTIPNGTLFAFEALVVGVDDYDATGGLNESGYKILGALARDDIGNTGIRNQIVTDIYEDDASYDVQCIGTSGALQIQVKDTDNDGASIRWVATVWGTMVTFDG